MPYKHGVTMLNTVRAQQMPNWPILGDLHPDTTRSKSPQSVFLPLSRFRVEKLPRLAAFPPLTTLLGDNVTVGCNRGYRARALYRPSRLLRDSPSGLRLKSPHSILIFLCINFVTQPVATSATFDGIPDSFQCAVHPEKFNRSR